MAKARTTALDVIQNAYDLGGTHEAWLDSITGIVIDAFGFGLAGGSMLYDASDPTWVTPLALCNRGFSNEFVAESTNLTPPNAETQRQFVQLFRSGMFLSMAESMFPLSPELVGKCARFGIDDALCLFVVDPTFRGCLVIVQAPRREYSPRTRYLWRQAAAHLSAGLRIRRTLSELADGAADPSNAAEAVLSPSGKIEHALGVAATPGARSVLQQALARVDRARRSAAKDEVAAVDLWTGLFAGRWSLIEHVESDGRRNFLAFRNDPALARARALSDRERQVVTYAAMGHSNKLIAYSLGLSLSTVGKHLERARRKLGGNASLDVLQSLLPSVPDELRTPISRSKGS